MVLHVAKAVVVKLQADGKFLQLLYLGFGQDELDALQMVGQRGEGVIGDGLVLGLQELGVDGDVPAFNIFLDGFVKGVLVRRGRKGSCEGASSE